MSRKLSKVELEMLQKIQQDPVLWAKTHLITYDGVQKKYVPWTARWYQAEMLRDQSRRKVYRCGRRTGGSTCFASYATFAGTRACALRPAQ